MGHLWLCLLEGAPEFGLFVVLQPKFGLALDSLSRAGAGDLTLET